MMGWFDPGLTGRCEECGGKWPLEQHLTSHVSWADKERELCLGCRPPEYSEALRREMSGMALSVEGC
jgi:hypothetical protein